jgi:hypothetical protein
MLMVRLTTRAANGVDSQKRASNVLHEAQATRRMTNVNIAGA